jgi:hypothetical protein
MFRTPPLNSIGACEWKGPHDPSWSPRDVGTAGALRHYRAMAGLHKARQRPYNVSSRRGARRSRMRFFRSHRLKVVLLALFALTCQFVLAFGHIHLDRLAGNSSHWAVAAASTPSPAVLPTSPRQNSPSGLGEDFCAICANAGVTGALVVPASPAVPPRISFVTKLHWPFAAVAAASFDHFPFDARGPPRA